MNICVDCEHCENDGDLMYLCRHPNALNSTNRDCRKWNPDGNCENFVRKNDERQKLRQLASFLLTAKHEEEVARKKRIEIEERIAALVDGPEVGQKTVSFDDGCKVTVERGFNYKADLADIEKLFVDNAHDLPETMGQYPPPIKTKTTRELDVTGYEWYRENVPTLFAEITKHVEAKPRKVAVSVKGA